MPKLHLGDCLEVMGSMPDDSIDSIVTDPPYGLAFMGAKWDSFGGSTGNETVEDRRRKMNEYLGEDAVVPKFASSHGRAPKLSEMQEFQSSMTPIFAEALRVAKPGAYLLCFGGTRTFHRMACAIEDAGWTVRDCIMWVYGSGFPHGMDVAKAIDKALGAKRPVVGEIKKLDNYGYKGNNTYGGGPDHDGVMEMTSSATPESARWEGWNICLKPAWEPIIVSQKPVEGTIAANVLKWGVGAMNIDACRVPTADKLGGGMRGGSATGQFDRPWMHDEDAQAAFVERKKANVAKAEQKGRYPANLVHDGSQLVLDLFPDTGKSSGGGMHTRGTSGHESTGLFGEYNGGLPTKSVGMGDSGSAARYFNTFRDGEDSAERTYADKGSTSFAAKPGMRRAPADTPARFFYCAKASKKDRGEGNVHPTVKPTALMEWLVKLVTPEGGVPMVLSTPSFGRSSLKRQC